jgi:hypothetical protein
MGLPVPAELERRLVTWLICDKVQIRNEDFRKQELGDA